jgi:hypothetical protein
MQKAFVERLYPSTQVQEGAVTALLSATLALRSCAQKTTNTPNIYLCITSEVNLKAYSHLTAQPLPDWHQPVHWVQSAGQVNHKHPQISEILKHDKTKQPRVLTYLKK